MMKIGRVVTDNRQTHKQTDTLIAILHVPPLLAAEQLALATTRKDEDHTRREKKQELVHDKN